jgi:hypothetical protein
MPAPKQAGDESNTRESALVVARFCQQWSDHDLEERYYGYQCNKCELFIPYGQEPWICEAGEEIKIDRYGFIV